jgi:hypothetical protein
MIVTKRVEGEVDYNDGQFAEGKAIGIEGIQKDLWLSTFQIHRENTDDTPDEFRERYPVGMFLQIVTTTEIRPVTQSPRDLSKRLCGGPKTMAAIEIREALEKCYPDVTDLEFSIKHSGFAHEHPLIAIGVLLISSIILKTTAPSKLAQFTRYSERFVRAVARNMEISGLWANDRYDFSSWYRGELVPPENREFWDHILIGEGSLWQRSTDCQLTQYTSLVFWADKLG